MMGSLFQRPVVAAAAVAVASFSANIHDRLSSLSDDLHERFRPLKFSDSLLASHSANLSRLNETSPSLSASSSSSWMPLISSSQLAKSSFTTVMGGPRSTLKHLVVDTGKSKLPSVPIGSCSSLVASSHILLKSYRLAELSKAPSPVDESNAFTGPSPTSAIPEVLYRWHLPQPDAVDFSNRKKSNCSLEKSRTVVVLLGWLGAKQKHLKRYADWYTSKGFHVISFTFPMAEVMSYQVGGKAEQNVDLLANHLAEWLEEEHGKNLVFHTFSNTGWLTYGAILEKFQKQDHALMGRIKGCIVDSAPVAAPDPQVWASGFSAAFLKKHSVATKGYSNTSELGEPKPAFTESAILLVLEKFFDVVLNLPTVNRRLSNVLGQLTSGQPSCPQLYIYSSADKVIPAGSVESFIATQQNSGREVRSCNFISTPHVDHFRHQPELYTSQLLKFLDDCVLACS